MTTDSIYPEEIERVVKFLREHRSLPITTGATPRSGSQASEEPIIKLLEEKPHLLVKRSNIGGANKSSWYDFKIGDYFCDLKISKLKGAGNMNAKKAIYYVLTGEDPTKISYKEAVFFKKLKENIKENSKDYYYIVIGKNETPGTSRRAFVTSLRTMPEDSVRTNRSNPPIQGIWEKCVATSTPRNYQETKDLLLSNYSECIKKGIKALRSGMPEYFSDYFPEYFPCEEEDPTESEQ